MKHLTVLPLLAFLLVPGAATQAAAPAPVFETLTKTTKSWDGVPLPAYPKGTPEVTILKVTYPPGSQTDLHFHPGMNAGVLLSGELTVFSETGETLHLKAGDPLVEIVGPRHYGRNDGETTAVLIMFYAGTPEAPITVPAK